MSASTNGSPPGFADRFRVESRLGRGGMGDVYKAYDAVLERTVAVKTLTPGNTGQQAVDRLLREARACARLTHPGIVVIYDVLRVEGSVHIVMEHLPGASLESLHRFPQFSTLEGKIDILIRVLDALHYAHGRGVVHRDVKPTNVQILPDGSVKLLDFGIAHLAGAATLTATGTLLGTPHYASPEQLRGEDIDAATDIYSAGVLAFELLTRRRPFEGDSLRTVLTKVLNEPLPAAGTWLSEAFPELERIIQRATAKRREDRYGTAEDMKNALAAFAGSSREAIVAKQAELAATTERMLIKAKSLIASNRTAEAIRLLTSVLRTNPDADEARSLLRAGDATSGAAGGPPAAVPADDEPTVLAGSDAPPPVSASTGGAGRAGRGPAGAPPFSAPVPPAAGAPSFAPTGATVHAGAEPAATGATVAAGAEHDATAAAQPWPGRRLLAAAAPVVVLALAVGVPAYFWMSAGAGDDAPASAASAPHDPGPAAAETSAALPTGSPDHPPASSGGPFSGQPGPAAAGGEPSLAGPASTPPGGAAPAAAGGEPSPAGPAVPTPPGGAAPAESAAAGAPARAPAAVGAGGAGSPSAGRAPGAGRRAVARPAPARVSEGSLTIRTLPGSVVELDGVEVGTTNAAGILAVDGIAAGGHVVVARKPGYGDATTTAGVVAGRSDVVELSLVELPGRLTATVNTPAAMLLIDGVGEYPLPVRGLELPAGRRRVTASRPGFMPAVEEVDIRPGEAAALSFALERVPVDVALREAQGHFNLRSYREAAEGAEAVLREYGEAGEAYLLLGRSLHALGRFEESADYLGRAVEAGQEVELPAKHRHGGLGLRAGFCDGVMIVSRMRVLFRSADGADHSFAVTPDKIKSVDVSRDRINTQIVVLDDARERERDFDFIHTDTVRQSSGDSSFFTETSCRRCDDSLLVLGAVLRKARGL